MDTIPFTSHREIFERLANVGNIAALSREDRLQYDYDLKKARDYNAEMRYVRQEGMERGMAVGRAEGIAEGMERGMAEGMERGRFEEKYIIASKLLESGFDLKKISEITDIPLTELQERFN